MDIEQFRKAGYAAVDAICDYYATMRERPVKSVVQPGYLIERLPDAAPEKGAAFELIAGDFQKHILPGITHWQHPQFFAYFPSISTFESMLADLYAASVSNPGFNWACSPACTELEQVVVDWMAGVLGLERKFWTGSGEGGGIILTSASDATLTAAIAAREKALRELAGSEVSHDPHDIAGIPKRIREEYSPRLVMYGSTQTHSSTQKAAILLGLQHRSVPVSIKDNYSMRGEALREAIEQDVAAGLIPFFVVATIGTTSTGAIDHIAEIGEVLRSYPTAYLHIDAAWAGVALALPDQRESLRLGEVNRYVDSFSTNMHKWGLVGFDCTLFYVRDRQNLTRAMDVTPAYLRTKEGDTGTVIDYRNWQLSLGRRFRSIKLWFVLRSYGVEGFRNHLTKGIELCQQLTKTIEQTPNFEIIAPPSLALVVFRLRPPSTSTISDAELNLLTEKLHIRLNATQDVLLTQTLLHSTERDIFCIRFAIGNTSTTWEDVIGVWKIVENEGRSILEEWEAGKE